MAKLWISAPSGAMARTSRCFPSTNALRKKFSIELEIKPLDAETTLHRLETLGVALIESSLAARTTDDYKERHTQMLQQATRTLVDSLAPVVRGLPATERDTIAYQALETAFTNIRVALGTLNLDNDGNLDELIAKLTVPAKPSDAAT